MLQHFVIDEQGDKIIGTDGTMEVLVTKDGAAKMFNRKAIRLNPKAGQGERDGCLVVELEGVRVYVRGTSIIVTKQDLYL